MVHKIVDWLKKHKILALVLFVALLLGGNYIYKKIKGNASLTSYVLGTVTKGTLINSVSGSGQVSVTDQVDVKSKVSGEVTSVSVALGQDISVGTILASVDARDAQRAVRNAQTDLQTAKLELDKLLAPTDELTLLQAENSLAQTKESEQKSEDDLKKAYEDGFNTISNAFLSLPAVMTGVQDILFANSFNFSQANIDFYAGAVKSYDDRVTQYRDDAYDKYQTARAAYDKNFDDYKSVTRFSDTSTIEKNITETYDTTKLISEAVKSANNLIQFYQDRLTEHNLKPSSISVTHISSLNSYTGTANNHLSNLLAIKQTIKNSQDSILNAQRTIAEKELSLDKIKNGPDDLDIRAKRIAVQQKEDALVSTQQALADHYIRAPFAGIVAKSDLKKGDSISSGSAVITLITKQHTAQISLNEVDAAKIKVGQKVNVTFDAIDGLSISGQVAEVDTIGSVSQGVVTYNVKIVLDTQDDRIKLGMSVSAAIITDIKQDVLIVPSSAVKTQNGVSYVEQLDQTIQNPSSQGVTSAVAPHEQMVQVGASNDTQTEIISGLKEGDQIIVRTIAASAAKPATTQAPSLFGGAGGGNRNFGGGGGARVPAGR
ncbi:MAG TPA: efflux RND transporter periplasmic adaptor subunit [Candidatus Udaeobacter sp.]|nr:efflux RND transporter periplasmic adaptor subunit [Candidatus Udaeobacter sp.]